MTDPAHARPTAAVVGGGVSGLTAAYLLAKTHHVTLFEADERVGGHAHTHDVDLSDGRSVPVDSGFIVLNDRTYPLLRRLFAELGVETRPTEMSMSISCAECGLNYVGGRGANGIFAQRRRVADPTFWRMLLTIRRFQKAAVQLLDEEPDSTLTYGEFLDRHGFGQHFVTHYALPIVSCVWSMGHREAMDYPAAYLFAFLHHHGFLVLGDAPTWHTVVGGSRSYVGAITQRLDVVRNRTRVTAVSRKPDARRDRRRVRRPPQLRQGRRRDPRRRRPRPADRRRRRTRPRCSGRSATRRTSPTCTATTACCPRCPAAGRAGTTGSRAARPSTDRSKVSYWMNRLQGHPEGDPLIVTLNPDEHDAPRDMIATMTYHHPTYTSASVAAQQRLAGLNTDRIAFAGAYQGWGFHEDGCRSGVAAAEALGATW